MMNIFCWFEIHQHFYYSRFSVSSASSGDTDIQYIKASELFPKKSPWIEGDPSTTTSSTPPFPFLPGEGILYEVCF
jgi:hypothetical protein